MSRALPRSSTSKCATRRYGRTPRGTGIGRMARLVTVGGKIWSVPPPVPGPTPDPRPVPIPLPTPPPEPGPLPPEPSWPLPPPGAGRGLHLQVPHALRGHLPPRATAAASPAAGSAGAARAGRTRLLQQPAHQRGQQQRDDDDRVQERGHQPARRAATIRLRDPMEGPEGAARLLSRQVGERREVRHGHRMRYGGRARKGSPAVSIPRVLTWCPPAGCRSP